MENKVGYLRRNELVPIPRFISELFEEDKARLLPLPSVPFDTALYTTATTDKYGKFTLDVGKHRYSASPAFCDSIVNLKITSSAVIVMDADMHEVVCHKRLYGDEHERMDWLPYLTYIARKPRSLRNSGIYDMMPRPCKYTWITVKIRNAGES